MNYISHAAFLGIFVVLCALHLYRKRLASYDSPSNLSAKSEFFYVSQSYWNVTIIAFGLISLLVFICSIIVYFKHKPYMLERWLLPTFEIFLGSSCFFFIALLAFKEHKKDFVSISSKYMEYKIGSKQEVIVAETICAIKQTKKGIVFYLENDKEIRIGMNSFDILEKPKLIKMLVCEFGEKVS